MTNTRLQNLDFTGHTALIMGASRGIGLATAKTLASYGAKVVLAARSLTTLKIEVKNMVANGQSAFVQYCDVSDYDSVAGAVEFTMETTGRLDILVNNAGIIEPLNYLVDSDPKLWGRAADINYKGVYYGMRAALPVMLKQPVILKQGRGVIVNISSGAANSALVGWSHYCSTKAAAKKLTEVAHKEMIENNIRVVGLSPGTVATELMEKIRDAKINPVSYLDWQAHIPPEWAAEGVAFLCGPEGGEFAGTDFSLKTPEGRKRVGLPCGNAPDV
ncbi:SDR family oxidoreductase [Agarilytica rhodophyticola]|uniref:SDR family oxidoreductase n=1 Tax=Agarilytica rhodophyticola TaxID=1737490 RepID=UPI000B347C27|nr:SDR family oxidoreductase [Agarilytica rhodophyticola]